MNETIENYAEDDQTHNWSKANQTYFPFSDLAWPFHSK